MELEAGDATLDPRGAQAAARRPTTQLRAPSSVTRLNIKTLPACLAALAFVAAMGAARAQELAVGVVAPLSGSNAILGQQVAAGARVAAGERARITEADDACSADGGQAAAGRLAAAKVDVVIGFLCTESIEAALPVLSRAGIPVITVGVRTDSLTDRREKTGWSVFRLGPRADAERAAASAIIPRLWRDVPFAIVDDGTIYGRELAESVRAAAEQRALRPVFVDTFRPQLENQIGLVGRLRRSGASAVFVGGDVEDVAVMARDAAQLGADLTFGGGETLRQPPETVPLVSGTIMVGLPDPASLAPKATLDALRDKGVVPEGYVLPAYAAMEIALQSQGMVAALANGRFQTAQGEISFDSKGDLAASPYRLFRFDGAEFLEIALP
ncbi:MAG: branched-chain amino acid ABC transporter substrate-binding protein [Methylobacterium mesophilicum]|nr:branched-chain amino acid ABC transporter substrate-binding protein [Methylobacterium mesophilicum]